MIFLPRWKNPSQVAHELTPCPISFCSEGKSSQRERARNEFQLAIRTKDNTQGAQEEAAKYIDKAYQRPSRSDI